MTSLPSLPIKLLTLSLAVLLVAIAFLALSAGEPVAQAQEPSPTATGTISATSSPTPSGTPSATACAGIIKGGQTVPTVRGTTITLPAGGTYDILIQPPGSADPTFTVCHAESKARVTINALTCREVSESVPQQSGALLIGQIVESCTTSAIAGATVVATQTPGGIQPPNTGNAGLAGTN